MIGLMALMGGRGNEGSFSVWMMMLLKFKACCLLALLPTITT